MDYVLLMAAVNLLLAFWVLRLQRRAGYLEEALEGATQMFLDLAHERAVIEKVNGGFAVRKVQDGRE